MSPSPAVPSSSFPADLQQAGQHHAPGAVCQGAGPEGSRMVLLWERKVTEGGSGLPSHPPPPADLQIFQFYCPCHQKEKFKPLTSSLLPVLSSSFFYG